jgi:hypothetical protein
MDAIPIIPPMRTKSLAFAFCVAAACGGGGGGSTSPDAADDPDGGPAIADAGAPIDSATDVSDAYVFAYDWSCVGQDPPQGTIPPTIHVRGQVYDATTTGLPGIANAQVQAFELDDSPLTSTTTNGNGSFDLALTTGGQPLEGYVRMTAPGFVSSYTFPQDPIRTNIEPLDVPMYTEYMRDVFLPAYLSPLQIDPGDGVIAILVSDCAGYGLRDAEIIVDNADANTRTLYISSDTGLPDQAMQRTGESGLAIIVNVNPGTTSVRFRHELAPSNDALQPIGLKIFGQQISAGQMHP